MADGLPAGRPLPLAAPTAPAGVLEALRRAGAARIDPVRLRYLDVLGRRIETAEPACRPLLQHRWQSACAELEQRCRQAPPHGVAEPPRTSPAAASPLAGLNHYIRSASRAASAASAHAFPGEDATELRSLRNFRETWSRIAAVDQVDAAVTRGPENAGPLNSHSLVLRSLALMRSLSPDYLRRFLSQMETLMALEQAAERQREPPPRVARKAAGKKR